MHNSRSNRVALVAGLALAAGLAVSALGADGLVSKPTAEKAILAALPGVELARTGSAVTTVSGVPLSYGNTPVESAEAFMAQHLGVFGVARGDLVAGSLAADNAHVRAFFPGRDANGRFTGQHKFTLVSYLQTQNGIPVYNGNIRFLVRNEPGSPLVMVRGGLFELGQFRANAGVAAAPNVAAAFEDAMLRFPGIGNFTAPRVVIFAGDDLTRTRPAVLAVEFEGSVGTAGDAGYGKWKIVADAATGKIVWTESQIRHIDVNGNISGQATTGFKAAECNTEALTGMPYARATIGTTSVFADVNGNFTVPNPGTAAVNVIGSLQGRWFEVRTPSALEPTITVNVTPPGPANIVFNSANTDQVRRASVNAYYHANKVRDFTLAASPSYPTIGTQTAFDVNVAVAGTCNAFYDGASINFYNSGGGCANTAFSDVVHHEYGHHLVQVAGSGQGEYGEGMGDVMGVLINDQPVLAFGFQNNCNAGIRNADNTCQYSAGSCSSCGSEIHACGQLISGVVWDLRNNLLVTDPSDYITIAADLAVNAMIVHNGPTIDSSIYTDYLVLDDDDANLGNGTPHFCQINDAFGQHGLSTGGSSAQLLYSYPSGRPAFINPAGGTVGQVKIVGACGAVPNASTARVFIDAENDGTYVQSSLSPIGGDVYTFSFPAVPCGGQVRYYFSCQTTTATTVVDPSGAPTNFYTTISGYGLTTTFSDNFQTNLGWTVSNSAGLTTGAWERAVPANNPFGAAPTVDADGSGFCYITQNNPGASVGDFDMDGGTSTVTSPTLNASGGSAFVSYSRWFSNNAGAGPDDDQFVVQISGNNGTTWQNLEVVGPNGGAEQHGGWYSKTFPIPGALATAQFRIRFTAGETGPSGSIVECGLDAVKLSVVDCNPPNCPADFNGDGFLSGDDFDQYVAAFEAGDLAADFNDDGFLSGDDFDAFVAAFNEGC